MVDYHKAYSDLKKLYIKLYSQLNYFLLLDPIDCSLSLLPYDSNRFVLNYQLDGEHNYILIPNKVIYDCLEDENSNAFMQWYQEDQIEKKINSLSKQLTRDIETLLNNVKKDEIILALELKPNQREKYFKNILIKKGFRL